MKKASRDFQVFAKPTGPVCNLACKYCYYLEKENLYSNGKSFRMPDDILEDYIVQHIEVCPYPVISFSWHGGEPTVLGLDYFQKIVAIQRRHQPPGRRITNGMQTNGTLLNDDWCRFLAKEGFAVGLSIDGPQEMHDLYRVTKGQQPTHNQVMRGYKLLRKHGVYVDILCVVHAHNAPYPIQVYRFFKGLKAQYLGFLPLVEQDPDAKGGISQRSVPAAAWGDFLCAIFDEWKLHDIGKIKVQIFEEAARTAFGQEHGLCIFRETCGDVPVIEHNGDFFSCDHYVDPGHCLGNIQETPLVEMLESPVQRAFGQAKIDTMPRYCRACDVRSLCNGGCPKNRFILTPDGETGLNYLCAGYKTFFTHCLPFLEELNALWRQRAAQGEVLPVQSPNTQARPKVGRNDPCPCGSGLKYKKCCGK